MPKIRVQSTAENARGFIPNTRASGASGAAVGSALKSLGSAVGGLGAELKAQQDKRDALDQQMSLAEFQTNAQKELIARQANAEDGAANFTEDYDALLEKEQERLLEGKTGEARQKMLMQTQEIRNRMGVQAFRFQVGEESRAERKRIEGQMDEQVNIIQSDPSSYDASVERMNGVFEAMSLPPDDEARLKENFAENAAIARFKGMFGGATSAEQIDKFSEDLGNEKWNKVLSPEAKSRLENMAEVQRGKIERQVLAEAKAYQEDFKERAARGEELPSSYFERGTEIIGRSGNDAMVEAWEFQSAKYLKQQELKGATPAQVAEQANVQRVNPNADYYDSAAELLRSKEGFRNTAYWDVNAYRTGYGSDTYTTADGKVHKVTKDSRITRADAERDIKRRIKEFEQTAIGNVGAEAWNRLSPATKTALLSITYNYGEIPRDRASGAQLRTAIRSGDPKFIAAEIRKLGGDNGGVNRGRRNAEADIVASGVAPMGDPSAYGEQAAAEAKAQEMYDGLESNPMAYADSEGVRAFTQLDPSEPSTFAQRSADYAAVQSYYEGSGVNIDKPLTKSEIIAFKEQLAEGTVNDKLNLLTNIGSMGAATNDALEQIGAEDRHSAYVAAVAQENPVLARDMLVGQQMMSEDSGLLKALVGKENDFRAAYAGVVQNTFGVLPAMSEGVYETAKSLYVQRQSLSSPRDGTIDEAALQKAVQDAAGGEIVEVGQGRTLTPQGVSAEEFQEFAGKLTYRDLSEFSATGLPPVYATGEEVDPTIFEDQALWILKEENTYAFLMEGGLSTLKDSSGQLYMMVLDPREVKDVVAERADKEPGEDARAAELERRRKVVPLTPEQEALMERSQ